MRDSTCPTIISDRSRNKAPSGALVRALQKFSKPNADKLQNQFLQNRFAVSGSLARVIAQAHWGNVPVRGRP